MFAGESRHTIRALRRSPGFAMTSGLTIAVAIWMNTTVLSVLDRVLLRPLPYADAERLVTVFEKSRQGETRLASYPTFLDWERQARAFDGLGFARGATGILRTDEGPERLTVAYVTPGWFHVLGARPRVGRSFLPDEEGGEGANVAVLSHALWERQFGGDRSAAARAARRRSRS